jgi:uncharacterized membrane protein YagU involved in acid resistance
MSLLKSGTCVKECPTANTQDPVHCYETQSMKDNFRYQQCQYFPMAQETSFGTEYFMPFRYSTENLLGHFCVPKGSDYVDKQTFEAFKKGFFESVYGAESARYVNDVIKSWPIILGAAILAVVFGYIYLFVIQYVGGLIIWGSLAATLVIMISAGLYSYFVARPAYEPSDPTFKALEYAAYVVWALALLLCTTACVCYNAI